MRRHALVGLVVLWLVTSAVGVGVGAVPVAATTQDRITLTVEVVDGDGDPLSGIEIEAEWEGGDTTARTASNGRAFVDVPRGANVSLGIDDDTYVRNFPVVLENASAQDVTIAVAEGGRATVVASGADGPVENATVAIVRDGRVAAQGTTDDDGTFESDPVEQGEYELVLSKPGYYENSTTLVVNDTRVEREVEMRTGSVQVTFRVLDDHFEDARPVENAQVAVSDVGTARTTGGTALFAIPVNTQLEVRVTKEAYQTRGYRIDVGESSTTFRLTTRRTETVTVTPNNERIVVGETTRVTVTNAYDEPIQDARVLLNGEQVAETGESGEATVQVAQAGNNTLRARAGGVESAPVTVVGVEAAEDTPTPTADATETAATTTTGVSFPGFTPVLAVLGVVLAAFLLRRR
jgi:uncharacterized GH25 family protein